MGAPSTPNPSLAAATRSGGGAATPIPRRKSATTRLSVWPPLSPGVYGHRSRPLPFPLEEATCRLFALGRHALWHGARAIGLQPGDEVLAPAYHHGSEIEALAQLGLTFRFYAAGDDLEPVESELESLRGERTRALLLIHYLGFPQRMLHWRRWCDERDLLLIEDAAQAWLAADTAPVGSAGDVAVFCLYKTFGLPDGAALVSRSAAPAPPGAPGRSIARVARRHAAWARSRIPLPPGRSKEMVAPDRSAAADDFTLGDPIGPVPGTSFLLRRLDQDAAARRRGNYEALLARLQKWVPPPFARLPAGASPFVFPVESDDKQAILHRLSTAGINAFDFWSFGHSLVEPGRFEAVERRRHRTVGLPVHQELRGRDVERIATVASEALEEALR